MNYKQSAKILREIKKAQKILLNCHRAPDPDSIGTALALKLGLEEMGKEVVVICPSLLENKEISFLQGFETIQDEINFLEFDFRKHDLFICLDSSNWDQVSASPDIPLPRLPIIVIDHHESNTNYGELNLVDKKSTSTGEMMYKLFSDWGVEPSNQAAECLMAAILSDTGNLQFPGVGTDTLQIVSNLLDIGVDKDKLGLKMFRSLSPDLFRFLGLVFSKIEINKNHKFVYSILEYKQYKHLDLSTSHAKNVAAMYIQQVDETEFGVVGIEMETGTVSFSIRSRRGVYDASQLATSLGGGGHIFASGCKIEGMSFSDAKELFLKTAMNFAKSYEAEK